VEKEIENLAAIRASQSFLNQEFTQKSLLKELQTGDYSLLHIATHGKFGGSPQSSFLQAFDQRLSLEDLQKLLVSTNNKIELLTLSACQTAAGNDRSVLGLGGVAIRAGVKTVLGSLWFVSDASVVNLVTDFYQNLFNSKMNRAEALRVAQLNQIALPTGHPAIWSNFVLLGSW